MRHSRGSDCAFCGGKAYEQEAMEGRRNGVLERTGVVALRGFLQEPVGQRRTYQGIPSRPRVSSPLWKMKQKGIGPTLF